MKNGNEYVIKFSKQAKEIYQNSNIVVIESKTIGQGYSALSLLDFSCDDPDQIEQMLIDGMQNVVTGLVSKASRTTSVNGIDIIKDNYIGFTNKTMLTSKSSKLDTLYDLFDKLNPNEKAFSLLIYGNSTTEEEQAEALSYIQSEYPDLEIYTLEGKQDVYDFIVIME